MIRRGIVRNADDHLGFADVATQEEAERLTAGKYQEGITIFIPVWNVSQTHADRKIQVIPERYELNADSFLG